MELNNIDIDDIIDTLIISVSTKEGIVKILMEVNADKNINVIIPRSESVSACKTNCYMDELNGNLLKRQAI